MLKSKRRSSNLSARPYIKPLRQQKSANAGARNSSPVIGFELTDKLFEWAERTSFMKSLDQIAIRLSDKLPDSIASISNHGLSKNYKKTDDLAVSKGSSLKVFLFLTCLFMATLASLLTITFAIQYSYYYARYGGVDIKEAWSYSMSSEIDHWSDAVHNFVNEHKRKAFSASESNNSDQNSVQSGTSKTKAETKKVDKEKRSKSKTNGNKRSGFKRPQSTKPLRRKSRKKNRVKATLPQPKMRKRFKMTEKFEVSKRVELRFVNPHTRLYNVHADSKESLLLFKNSNDMYYSSLITDKIQKRVEEKVWTLMRFRVYGNMHQFDKSLTSSLNLDCISFMKTALTDDAVENLHVNLATKISQAVFEALWDEKNIESIQIDTLGNIYEIAANTENDQDDIPDELYHCPLLDQLFEVGYQVQMEVGSMQAAKQQQEQLLAKTNDKTDGDQAKNKSGRHRDAADLFEEVFKISTATDLVDALSDIMNNQCREISKRVSQENQKNWMLNAYQVIDRMFTHWTDLEDDLPFAITLGGEVIQTDNTHSGTFIYCQSFEKLLKGDIRMPDNINSNHVKDAIDQYFSSLPDLIHDEQTEKNGEDIVYSDADEDNTQDSDKDAN